MSAIGLHTQWPCLLKRWAGLAPWAACAPLQGPNHASIVLPHEGRHHAEASVGALLKMLCSSTCSSFKDFAASLDAVQLKVTIHNSALFCSAIGLSPLIPVDICDLAQTILLHRQHSAVCKVHSTAC